MHHVTVGVLRDSWCVADREADLLKVPLKQFCMTLLCYYGLHAPCDSWCVVDREVCGVHNPAQGQVRQPVCAQQVP